MPCPQAQPIHSQVTSVTCKWNGLAGVLGIIAINTKSSLQRVNAIGINPIKTRSRVSEFLFFMTKTDKPTTWYRPSGHLRVPRGLNPIHISSGCSSIMCCWCGLPPNPWMTLWFWKHTPTLTHAQSKSAQLPTITLVTYTEKLCLGYSGSCNKVRWAAYLAPKYRIYYYFVCGNTFDSHKISRQ